MFTRFWAGLFGVSHLIADFLLKHIMLIRSDIHSFLPNFFTYIYLTYKRSFRTTTVSEFSLCSHQVQNNSDRKGERGLGFILPFINVQRPFIPRCPAILAQLLTLAFSQALLTRQPNIPSYQYAMLALLFLSLLGSLISAQSTTNASTTDIEDVEANFQGTSGTSHPSQLLYQFHQPHLPSDCPADASG